MSVVGGDEYTELATDKTILIQLVYVKDYF